MNAYDRGRQARRNGVEFLANPCTWLIPFARWEAGWLDEDAAIEADPNLVP